MSLKTAGLQPAAAPLRRAILEIGEARESRTRLTGFAARRLAAWLGPHDRVAERERFERSCRGSPDLTAFKAGAIDLSANAPLNGPAPRFRASPSCSSGRRFHQVSLGWLTLAPPAGLEPAASAVTGRRALQLLHEGISYGSPGPARTDDPRINSAALYRLSYQGMDDGARTRSRTPGLRFRRPPLYPAELYAHKLILVEPAGIEPATSCLQGRRSPN